MDLTAKLVYDPEREAWGYRIDSADGSVRVLQRWTPGVAGFVPMTKEQAEAYMAADLAALQAGHA